MLFDHIYITQIILPIFFGLVLSLMRSRGAGHIASACILFANILSTVYIDSDVLYKIGSWSGNIGIEYKFTYSNQRLLLYLCLALSAWMHFLSRQQDSPNRAPLMLFLHAGLSAICVTHDIFNLYVSVEIAALSAYALACNKSIKQSYANAFEYLILCGTGAICILLGIGFILAKTGYLNIGTLSKKDIGIGAYIIILGLFIKLGIFPFCSWTKIYQTTAAHDLAYIGTTSSLVYGYSICTIVSIMQQTKYLNLFIYWAMCSTAIHTIHTIMRTKSITDLIMYSARIQGGYFALFGLYGSASSLFVKYAIVDYSFKVMLILYSKYSNAYQTLSVVKSAKSIIPTIIISMSAVGIPITIGFTNKIALLLTPANLTMSIIIAAISAASVAYYARFMQSFFASTQNEKIIIQTKDLVFLYLLALINLLCC